MSRPRGGTALFLNVGQGDASLLIDTASKLAILVDCPAGREEVVEAALADHGAYLDTAVITHFDSDHSAGLVTLLKGLGCRELLFLHDTNPTATVIVQYRDLLSISRRLGMTLTLAHRGQAGHVGTSLLWAVLSPDGAVAMSAAAGRSRNRLSLVLRVSVVPSQTSGDARTFIIPGDADLNSWSNLLAVDENLKCDVLRWPHHGAAMGGSRAGLALPKRILEATEPGVVIIGVGTRNSYGHPAAATIDAIVAQPDARVMCTEVTPLCHEGLGVNTPCAGGITIDIGPSGEMVMDPTYPDHDVVIDGWSQPRCRAMSSPNA